MIRLSQIIEYLQEKNATLFEDALPGKMIFSVGSSTIDLFQDTTDMILSKIELAMGVTGENLRHELLGKNADIFLLCCKTLPDFPKTSENKLKKFVDCLYRLCAGTRSSLLKSGRISGADVKSLSFENTDIYSVGMRTLCLKNSFSEEKSAGELFLPELQRTLYFLNGVAKKYSVAKLNSYLKVLLKNGITDFLCDTIGDMYTIFQSEEILFCFYFSSHHDKNIRDSIISFSKKDVLQVRKLSVLLKKYVCDKKRA